MRTERSWQLELAGIIGAVVFVVGGGYMIHCAGCDARLAGQCLFVIMSFVGAARVGRQLLRIKRPQPLVPVKHTNRPRALDFPAREFRHENRALLTGVLGFFAVAALIGAAVLYVKMRNSTSEPGFAEVMTAVLALVGGVCAWCAVRVWTASVVLAPEGVTVHTTNVRGRFAWDELIAFERVQISDGNGAMRWWFRLVTAKKAYLFQDTLEDRAALVRTITQASGLELVDAG